MRAKAAAYAILNGAAGTNQALVSAPTGTAPDLTYTITTGTGQRGDLGDDRPQYRHRRLDLHANAAALDGLGAGVTQTLALTAQVTDFATATDTQGFTITLTGAEDAAGTATIADATADADGDATATSFEVLETTSSTLTNIATITVTDPDTDYAVSAFTISDTRFEVAKSGNVFTLRIKAGQAFDFDETPGATNTFTFTVSGPGLAQTTFTGTITDSPDDNNQAPTLAGVGAGDLAGAITEDASPNTATGTLNFADTDTDDTAASLIFSTGKAGSVAKADETASHDAPADPAADTAAAAGAAPADVTGTYGTFSFTRDNAAGTLQWTYTLDNSNAAVQALRDGQVAYDKLAVKVADDGGAATTQIITVTITGDNDDPVLDVGGDAFQPQCCSRGEVYRQ